MRRIATLTTAVLTLGCGAAIASPSTAIDPSRRALVDALCAPLPHRAFDCIVGWPASVPPARREAVATASGGESWASVPGVRAFASCSDRPAEDGPVSHVVSIVVDPSVGSAEEIAERLPVRVRWTEECSDELGDCAAYYAHAEGDRVVLTRRVQRPMATDEDVAYLACAAVADGSEEAHVRIDGYGALVRAIDVDANGVTTTSRRPARGESERAHRTWTELDLGVLDERLERESDMRTAAMGRAIDPDQVDVANQTALDMQVGVRQRRIARDPSPDAYRALARLTQRGFEAHPSRPDLARLAISASMEAHDLDTARAVLTALASTVGDDDVSTAELGARLDAVAGDSAGLARRITRSAPELSTDRARHVADALIMHLAAHPLPLDAWFAPLLRAITAAARAETTSLLRRAPTTITPVAASAWAIQALANGDDATLVAVCSDAVLPTNLGGRATPGASGGTVLAVFATLDHCAAVVVSDPLSLGRALIESGVSAGLSGATRVLVEIDGSFVGVGGALDAGDSLRVTSASASLTHADLARAQREVVAPLAAIGTRVFPAPTLTLPLPSGRRDAALAALSAIEGVVCGRSTTGVSCTLESYEPVEQLVEAVVASFRAE